MLFLSRGRTLRFHEFFNEAPRTVLEKYMETGFTGRIQINTPDYYVEIELLDGKPVAIIAREQGTGSIMKGKDALKILGRVLDSKEGFAEIVELSKENIGIDLESEPEAAIDQSELRKMLGTEKEAEQAPETLVQPVGEIKISEQMLAMLRTLLKDVGTLVKMILRSEETRTFENTSIAEALGNTLANMSPDHLVYANCRLDDGLVINILCDTSGCAMLTADGKTVDASTLVSKRGRCKLYITPRIF
ncbi:hypothetical protein PYJP_06870 [Pyrofollis japonicus]|uniref:hypothetical protein n=1 Tax=Pyrofollis japonicus TaxID=3060460 RepID=UPI00295B1C1E|nr:hypothetical protein [Pyrofollis japonicus]BEP17335.1 hypothetical protein PYJP_06870 [Pyrofollis japonicus]